MKKRIALWLSILLLVSSFSSGSAVLAIEKSKPVSKQEHWATKALEVWKSAGVIQGYQDGSLRPDGQITTVEYVVMMNRIFGFQETVAKVPAEIPADAWYAKDLTKALEAGYLPTINIVDLSTGYLTRAQAAWSLTKLFALSVPVEAISFSDTGSLDAESIQAIQTLASAGYIKGYPDGTFRPDRTITRGEIASILDRLLVSYVHDSGVRNVGGIQGNMLANQADVILKDGKITGNLYFSQGLGNGDASLENITVEDTFFVRGGGEESIEVNNSIVKRLDVNRPDGRVRVHLIGSTQVEETRVGADANLDNSGAPKANFGRVALAPNAANISLTGHYDEVVVPLRQGTDGQMPIITISGTVKELVLNGPATIRLVGGAEIVKLVVSAQAAASTVNGKIQSEGNYFNVKSSVSAPTGGTQTSGGGNNSGGGPGGEVPSSPWTLVWSDEFSGSELNRSKWTFDLGNGESVGNPGWGNNELEYYTDRPENVSVEDGNLVITAVKESQKFNGFDYTSSRIKTKGLFSKKYGKFDIRAKAPSGKGLWPAIWMLPEHDAYGVWAASGEIDIMEGWGSDTGKVGGTLHYGGQWPNNTYTGKEYRFENGGTTEDYHVYGLEWEPGEIRWYVDGKLYSTQNDWFSKSVGQPANNAYPAPFDEPFHLLLNLAVGGHFDGDPTADTEFPAKMLVDYVRVYELTGREYREPVVPSTPKEDYPVGSIAALEDGNLMRNGDFTKHNETSGIPNIEGVVNTDYWNLFIGEGGAGGLTIENIDGKNYAKVSITNAGNQPYSIQPLGIVSLAKGRYYKLSFDAKSDDSRNMSVKLTGGSSRGFAAYSQALQADLNNEFNHYELPFQMKQDGDIAARIEFNMGLNTHPVWLGNVRLVEVDSLEFDHDVPKVPLADGNHIYNGTFDQGEVNRLSYWHILEEDGAKVKASVDPVQRKLNLNITSGGTDKSSVQLVQRGISLIKGLEYELSFDAKASADREIEVELTSKNGTSYGKQLLTLRSSRANVTAQFKMLAETDEASQIIFHLGGKTGTIELDNIRLVRTSVYFDPDTVFYPLINGDFSGGLEPWQLVNPEGGGASNATLEDDMAKVTITNSGTKPHSVLFFQEGLAVSKGLTYILEFDAKSSMNRKMKVSVENASYASYINKTVDLTNGVTHFTYEFQTPNKEMVGLKFLLGNVGDGVISDSHEVWIDNVELKVKDAPGLKPPVLKADSTGNNPGNTIAITFSDNEAWRKAINTVLLNGNAVDGQKYDIQEGILTLDGSLFSSAERYEIIVKAEGYANAMVNQPILSANGNLVTQGSFDEVSNAWVTWTGDGGAFDFSVEDGTAKLDITGKGPNNWSNQFYQANIPMVAGKTYELSFKAWSTVARDITVEFSDTSGGSAKFDITATEAVYKKQFTVDSSKPLKLNFLIGKGVTEFDTPHTLYLDDIEIREVTNPSAGTEGHDLLNGDFSQGTESWDIYTNDGSNAEISAADGELKVDFKNYDGWNSWSTQIYQNKLNLKSGTTYTLSFDASSSLDKRIGVDIVVNSIPDGSSGKHLAETLDLTSDKQTFTYVFSVGDSGDPNAKLVFLLGSQNVPGEQFISHNILLDNVTLVEKK